mmetsp:Transcript_44695/g.112374  ORF Transcript_44695/g.112374 Transcript_44695/m.112374 type:complete len:737 (-) Transcript_44695:21-2231(-)
MSYDDSHDFTQRGEWSTSSSVGFPLHTHAPMNQARVVCYPPPGLPEPGPSWPPPRTPSSTSFPMPSDLPSRELLESPAPRCDSPPFGGSAKGGAAEHRVGLLEAWSPEVRPLCPQPRRPIALFEGPSLPASPGPPESETREGEPLDCRLPQPPGLIPPRDLCEMLGLNDKRDPTCEARPLSSQSTSAGPTPSPDELSTMLRMSMQAISPFSSAEDHRWDMPWTSDFGGVAGHGLCRAGEPPGMPFSPSPDDLPMMVHPFPQLVSPPGLPRCATPNEGVVSPCEAAVGTGHWAACAGHAIGIARTPQPPTPVVPSREPTPQQQRQQQTQPQRQRRQQASQQQQPSVGGRSAAKAAQAAAERTGQHYTKEAVVQMSKTQAGSKLLQQKLLKGHPTVISEILEGIEMELPDIMCNMYGNYLCSASFQACSVSQRMRMLEIAAFNLRTVAIDKWGTHALQSLISLVCTAEEQALLMPALREHIIELSCDPNGAHVVQRALISFGEPCPDSILQEIASCLRVVAHNPHGLCVLKKCISQSRRGPSQQRLLHELAYHVVDLAQGPYGNYAVQHALEEWGGEACRPIIESIRGHLAMLSNQKFSLNVVERVLRFAPADLQEALVEELANSDQAFSHDVVRRLTQAVPPEHRGLADFLSGGTSGSSRATPAPMAKQERRRGPRGRRGSGAGVAGGSNGEALLATLSSGGSASIANMPSTEAKAAAAAAASRGGGNRNRRAAAPR